MKKYALLPLLVCLFQSCSNTTDKQSVDTTEQYTPPVAGTIVAASKMPIVEDSLNNLEFSVKLKSTANSSTKGTYAIEAEWGYNLAQGEFTMPAGGEHLKPILKKGQEPYTYIIGFNYGKDSSFNDYFLISGAKNRMEMKYMKGYSFK